MADPATDHLSTPLGFRVWLFTNNTRMMRPHTHADIEINFLTEGSLQYRHGGIDAKMDTGEVGIFWGGIPHQLLKRTPRLGGVWLTVPISWLLRWQLPGNLTGRLLAGKFVRLNGGEAAFQTWQKDFASKEPARIRVLELELQAMLHRTGLSPNLRKTPRTSRSHVPLAHGPRIERVTTYLAARYHESLSLSAIAKAEGVHPKYLARIFKRYCGISVWQYLTRLRIAHAQRLLLTTDLKIIDVALESGFGSVAPFYVAFAQYGGGRGPGRFRRDDRSIQKTRKSPAAK